MNVKARITLNSTEIQIGTIERITKGGNKNEFDENSNDNKIK